ncbi:response regulator transcription factor [Nocardia sp. CA-107356]|uniref:helix-turn-helix transcriptional regulator n=1 Tax=Nocardia sp. CA-107356 TaxID=3239972 RepID=UPI003D8D2184
MFQLYPIDDLPPLTSRDLDSILCVLEDCERAHSVTDLRKAALEGMARYLGYSNTTFRMGDTLDACFLDRTAVLNGDVTRMLPAYLEKWQPHDPFAQPAVVHLLGQYDVASLDWLPCPRRESVRDYLDKFLFANRVHAKVVIRLRSSQTNAMIGLLAPESGTFGPRDLAIGRLVSRHLGGLTDLHLKRRTIIPAGLTPRQAEVVDLVAQGLTNVEIAERLYVGIDTVKKHLTQALSVTGCRNRTALALFWLSGRR